MHFSVIFRVLGMLLMLFSLTMLVPLIFTAIYRDGTEAVFVSAFVTTLIVGMLLFFATRKSSHELRVRDGFLVTALFWFVLGVFGSLPFILSSELDVSTTDAVFESISGLTTTGATVLTGLDNLPPSILYYRQQLQWLGGIGIIVIAVAILPMLGIGGMQLYRAETPGPVKHNKLTPRITGTAKALFYLYVSLTASCAFCYWLAGMSPFDALAHSFSTISIGGFSTHDASMAYFDNPAILMVAIFYMFFAGVNFALHFFAWQRSSFTGYTDDSEFRFYFFNMLVAIVVISMTLWAMDSFNASDSLLHGAFQVVSIATTTGFTSADFSVWPVYLPTMLMLSAFIGGCAGSTGGGIKVIRIMLMCKQGLREVKQLIHPHAIIPIKLGGRPISGRVMAAVWGFLAVYIVSFVVLMMIMMALRVDFVTAFSAVAASLNNLGPGLGDVAYNYGTLGDPAKWLLCFAMLLGRLEIFTLLVLFTPMFWRK